ncbi:hypothetical protein O181_111353 [Austropuccinia psidii MF-1]|uniref:Uncharacterized protein n=1 Tax=Austropuccinia psidii MF-1 TaxID=1389203 RepID=A0A9Q3PRM6_9BASI|nr:hypothetical protein [Austropuccinia psidii MF-1]
MNPLPCSSLIIPNSPRAEDLILGYAVLYHFNPIIDWKNGFITYDSSHKDSSGIEYSTGNDLATSFKSVALVDKLKTPSLPPPVYIPPIIPSQSLLPSRDERCYEICCYIFTSSLSRGYGPSFFILSCLPGGAVG